MATCKKTYLVLLQDKTGSFFAERLLLVEPGSFNWSYRGIKNIFLLCSRIFKISHKNFSKIIVRWLSELLLKNIVRNYWYAGKYAGRRFSRTNDRLFHLHRYQENYSRFRVNYRSVNRQHVVIQPILIPSQTAKSNKCYDWSIFAFGNFHSERTC